MGEEMKAAAKAVGIRSPGVVVGREFSSLSRLAQGVKFKNQLLQSITKRFQPALTSTSSSASNHAPRSTWACLWVLPDDKKIYL